MDRDIIRTFVAIDLDKKLKNELGQLIKYLEPYTVESVKWVSYDGMHITLKFLGNTKKEMIKDIIQVINDVCQNRLRFKLKLSSFGFFPNINRPRVLWMGIEGDITNLMDLQHDLEIGMNKLGFDTEKRDFSPHITLGRVREGHKINGLVLKSKIEEYITWQFHEFTVDKVDLVMSTLLPSGAVYTNLGSIKLS